MLNESPTASTIRTPSSYPASQKRYFQGSRADLRIPYREIALSPTRQSNRLEENPPLAVYDTSGSYTDPNIRIDLTALPAHELDQGTRRHGNSFWPEFRICPHVRQQPSQLRRAFSFFVHFSPRPQGQKRQPDALRPQRHRYAGDGICCSAGIDAAGAFIAGSLLRIPRTPAPRTVLGHAPSRTDHTRVCACGSGFSRMLKLVRSTGHRDSRRRSTCR